MKIGELVKKASKNVKISWGKHGQLIMTGITIIGACGAVYEVIRNSEKSADIKNEHDMDLDLVSKKFENKEIDEQTYTEEKKSIHLQAIKAYTLLYWRAFGLLGLAVVSTIVNYKVSIAKQAALLASLYATTAKKDEFEAKAKELLGDKKFSELKNAVAQDHLDKTEIPEDLKEPEYEMDPDGNYVSKPYFYPCMEDWYEHPFPSDASKIESDLSKAATYCKSHESITMNKIYEFLDPSGRWLRPSTAGEKDGFIAEDLVDNYSKLPYHITSMMKAGHDHAFTVIVWDTDPVNVDMDYDRRRK